MSLSIGCNRGRRRTGLGLAGAALLVFLGGCAAPRQLTAVENTGYWAGRMSIQVLDSPPQTTSGSFELSGSPANGELVLLNPLGNIVARVRWAPGEASVAQGSKTRQADSLDALTQDLLGTTLPIPALFDWLQGQATQVAGWQADLSARDDGKITARRTSPLPEASLRIVLEAR